MFAKGPIQSMKRIVRITVFANNADRRPGRSHALRAEA